MSHASCPMWPSDDQCQKNKRCWTEVKSAIFSGCLILKSSERCHPTSFVRHAVTPTPSPMFYWFTGWMNFFFLKAFLVRSSEDMVSCSLARSKSAWWVSAKKRQQIYLPCVRRALSHGKKEAVGRCDSCIIHNWLRHSKISHWPGVV